MISMPSCVRGKISVHSTEEWRFRCIHVWGVGFRYIYYSEIFSIHSCVRGEIPVHLPEEWRIQCIHVWGVEFWSIYLRDDDFGAFMYKGYDSAVFTWGVTISVHSCVRGRIPVHLFEGWRFQCHHVWGVGFWCIFLRSDDSGAFMCEGCDSNAFTTKMMISVHSCVRRRIPVHLLEGWWFRCIHVW